MFVLYGTICKQIQKRKKKHCGNLHPFFYSLRLNKQDETLFKILSKQVTLSFSNIKTNSQQKKQKTFFQQN